MATGNSEVKYRWGDWNCLYFFYVLAQKGVNVQSIKKEGIPSPYSLVPIP